MVATSHRPVTSLAWRMPSVKIAPVTRRALRKITATEPSGADQDQRAGKFWYSDSDTDSECEELGDAEPTSLRISPATVTSTPAPRSSSPAPLPSPAPPPPRRIKAPWKNIWRGPLPPPRITPIATIGDYLQPALQQRVPRRPSGGDPRLAGFQISKSHPGIRTPEPVRLNQD